MKNRDKLLPAVVLLLTITGFLLPELTAGLGDAGMEQETVEIRDTQKEIPLTHTGNFLEILEQAGTMKQSAELRNGEYMDAETAEKKAEALLEMLMRYGIAENKEQCRWLISPVLVSGIKSEEEETARVFWDCVWYPEKWDQELFKIEICLDDQTGYLVSFTVFPGIDKAVQDPRETAEDMKEFLNAYYPSSGRTEFTYTEKQEGNEFVFMTTDENEKIYELRFLIMENGQVVFNM